jgi:hypothetical protein
VAAGAGVLCSAHSRCPLTAIWPRGTTGAPAAIPRGGRRHGPHHWREGPLRAEDPFRKDGRPGWPQICTRPLTGVPCVSRVYTDDGVFVLTDHGVGVHETCEIGRHDLAERLSVTFQDSCDSEAACLSAATVS